MHATSAAAVALAAVAARQYGVFTRESAIRCGYSASAVHRIVRSGRWAALHPGVYLDRIVPPSPEQAAIAAWLACGPEAAVSHRTAARLAWHLDVAAPSRPQVTVPVTRCPAPRGVDVRRTRHLTRTDVVRAAGMRVTSPARTLLDVACEVDAATLEATLDSMWRRRLVDPGRLARLLDEPWCATRAGSSGLRELARCRIGRRAPGSDLETLYLRILRNARLPLPEAQFPVEVASGPRKIDCAYPANRVAIELDGFTPHVSSRDRFDDDRVRQNEIEALGWTFRRFTFRMLAHSPLVVVVTTAEAIGLTPARWSAAR